MLANRKSILTCMLAHVQGGGGELSMSVVAHEALASSKLLLRGLVDLEYQNCGQGQCMCLAVRVRACVHAFGRVCMYACVCVTYPM